MNISLRTVLEDDGEKIQEVALKAWQYTYRDIFTSDFIQDFVKKAYNPSHMPAYLKQIMEKQSQFVVACDDEDIVGFAQIGIDWDFKGEYRLSRIYLLPEYIGKGIGKQLMNSCEDFLKEIGQSRYGLYVHKENSIGKNFYFKIGFRHMPERDDDDEMYLVKEI